MISTWGGKSFFSDGNFPFLQFLSTFQELDPSKFHDLADTNQYQVANNNQLILIDRWVSNHRFPSTDHGGHVPHVNTGYFLAICLTPVFCLLQSLLQTQLRLVNLQCILFCKYFFLIKILTKNGLLKCGGETTECCNYITLFENFNYCCGLLDLP